MNKVHVVGSGLAGSEAAYFLAQSGVPVVLHEMRPKLQTAAHKTDQSAELVCSNSFKSMDPESAPGMLKAEMRMMGSLILKAADLYQVPAGGALAVDRDLFSRFVTETLAQHPLIERRFDEVTEPFANELTLFATGPLTSDNLSAWIAKHTDKELYFYDAIAPIIDAASIDRESAFLANRYDKGDEEAYLNCPLNKEEYEAFVDALLAGEKVTPKNFEKEIFFQGCQPIEAIAASGRESLRFGPMKPVGLTDPKTGRRPYAVLQLRPENKSRTAYNLVGFQTKLKYGEQSRIFKMIPALKNAEYIRLGSIHRNTYVCGPNVLNPNLSLKKWETVFLAGQITGVEGYLESAACGLIAANFIKQKFLGLEPKAPPVHTALGSLLKYITQSSAKHYQPMNACFALFDPSDFSDVSHLKRDEMRKTIAKQAFSNFSAWWNNKNPIHLNQSHPSI